MLLNERCMLHVTVADQDHAASADVSVNVADAAAPAPRGGARAQGGAAAGACVCTVTGGARVHGLGLESQTGWVFGVPFGGCGVPRPNRFCTCGGISDPSPDCRLKESPRVQILYERATKDTAHHTATGLRSRVGPASDIFEGVTHNSCVCSFAYRLGAPRLPRQGPPATSSAARQGAPSLYLGRVEGLYRV